MARILKELYFDNKSWLCSQCCNRKSTHDNLCDIDLLIGNNIGDKGVSQKIQEGIKNNEKI